ncbi:MAG: AAA family ATPase, partial [Chthoniobacteraceae bacterium]
QLTQIQFDWNEKPEMRGSWDELGVGGNRDKKQPKLDSDLPRALAELFVNYRLWTAIGNDPKWFKYEVQGRVVTIHNKIDTELEVFKTVFIDGTPKKDKAKDRSCFTDMIACSHSRWQRKKNQNGRPPHMIITIKDGFLPPDCVDIYWDLYGKKPLTKRGHLEKLCKLLASSESVLQKSYIPPPVEGGKIIGREQDIKAIRSLFLDEQKSFVTVHALAGNGKSTLLKAAAENLRSKRGLEVHYIDLTETRSVDDVINFMMANLGRAASVPRGGAKELLNNLVDLLKQKRRVLLVLDNFETAIAYARPLVESWQKAVPKLCCLIGSRVLVELPKEHSYPLESLRSPSLKETDRLSAVELKMFPAVSLFCERLKNSPTKFDPDNEHDVRLAAKICSAYRGWPQAIVLACARLETMNLKQLLESTSDPDMCGIEPQLKALFEDGLTPAEQVCLLQAGQFQGGFNPEILSKIWMDDQGKLLQTTGKGSVVQVLEKLQHLSFLNSVAVRYPGRATSSRRVFNLPIEAWVEKQWRNFVLRKPRLQERHQTLFHECYVELFKSLNEQLTTKERAGALAEMLDERQNILMALENAGVVSSESMNNDSSPARFNPKRAIEIIKVLARGMRILGPARLFNELLEKTLASSKGSVAPADLAFMLRHHSETQWDLGEWEEALALAKKSHDVAIKLGEVPLRCDCEQWYLKVLGDNNVLGDKGKKNIKAILKQLEELEKIAVFINDHRHAAEIRILSARFHDDRGNADIALEKLDKVVDEVDCLEPHAAAQFYNRKGITLWRSGRITEAIDQLNLAISMNEQLQDFVWLAGATTNLAFAKMDADKPDFDEVAGLLKRAKALHLEVGNVAWERINCVAEARLLLRRRDYGGVEKFLRKHKSGIENGSDPQNRVLMNTIRGIAMACRDETAEALEILEPATAELLKSGPFLLRHFAARVTAAECASKLKRKVDVNAHLSEAAKVIPVRNINQEHPAAYIRSYFDRYNALTSSFQNN